MGCWRDWIGMLRRRLSRRTEPARSPLVTPVSRFSRDTPLPLRLCRQPRAYGFAVGLTGVIYAIIVVGWAVFLVPLALRRHDQAARNRSIEKFSSAMRVLSRQRTEDGRVVVTPPRAGDRLLTPSLSHADDELVPVAARPTRASLKAAAARRRRVLLVLVSLTLLVGAVSVFGLLPPWSAVVPIALIVAFLAMARRQVRLASDRYWQEAAEARPEPTNVVRRPAVRVDASHGVERATDEDDEPTVTLTAEQLRAAARALEQEIVDVIALETADGASLWDPLPITLPTYVDKPPAARSYRTIDLDGPNTWSAGHSAADSATAAEGDTGDQAASETAAEAPRAANA
jgi:hypothetical protein